jgi:hypothetical protein
MGAFGSAIRLCMGIVVGSSFAAVLLTMSQVPVHAQRIAGVVVEDGTESVVPAARVMIADTAGRRRVSVETDSAGTFELPVAAGAYVLQVERTGFRPYASPSIDVPRDMLVRVTIRLGVAAIPLEPISVTVHAGGRLTEFERNLTDPSRVGRFFTQDELDARPAARTTDFLVQVPSVEVRPRVQMRGSSIGNLGSTLCTPALFLNGARFYEAGDLLIDDVLIPTQLEGIEVYSRRMFAPAQYTTSGDCGVILFWTRHGEPDAPRGWKRLIAGSIGMGVLLMLIVLN